MTENEQEIEQMYWMITRFGCDVEYYTCPKCDEAYSLYEGTPKDNNYNYCPNCGQRLLYEDKDGSEEE